VKINHVHKYF